MTNAAAEWVGLRQAKRLPGNTRALPWSTEKLIRGDTSLWSMEKLNPGDTSLWSMEKPNSAARCRARSKVGILAALSQQVYRFFSAGDYVGVHLTGQSDIGDIFQGNNRSSIKLFNPLHLRIDHPEPLDFMGLVILDDGNDLVV